jgi:hypothetical protein
VGCVREKVALLLAVGNELLVSQRRILQGYAVPE